MIRLRSININITTTATRADNCDTLPFPSDLESELVLLPAPQCLIYAAVIPFSIFAAYGLAI